MSENVVIMGAAGRDFHNFNVFFRDNPAYRVLAFTATQIPDIEGRLYPPSLAGPLYPDGIPIHTEDELEPLIRSLGIDLAVFSYSDIPYDYVMHRAARANAAGASFLLLDPRRTMLACSRPVVSVCAVRTGCGKSQTTRHLASLLQGRGKNVVVVRHPMPYGDLAAQAVQRFSSYPDFAHHHCTIEEREEYEPLVEQGITVYAGVDYEKILRQAEAEADVIIWDGGNNDTPFFVPDLHVVILDPHRAGNETAYHPGETNLLMADVALINKVDSAPPHSVERLKKTITAANPGARIVLAASAVLVDHPERIRGKRVLIVEDGPTLTHGNMAFGAGTLAAQAHQAAAIVDPRPTAVGSIAETFRRYPHLGAVLPAVGYSRRQVQELELTIAQTDCDLVLFGTPINLPRLLSINKPTLQVRYEYRDMDRPTLGEIVLERLGLR